MAIGTITVKDNATALTPTGGTDLVFTQTQPGRLVYLLAGLGTPMYIDIDSTYRPEGGDSSYLFKSVTHKQRTNPDATDESDAKFSIHTVIKCELKDWVESEINRFTMNHVQALMANGVLSKILRGDR